MMKKAFTLAEILIVVAILGILASLVIPTFQTHAAEAKEAAAKDNLRILRTAIERYAAEHNGQFPDGIDQTEIESKLTGKTDLDGTPNASGDYGPYLRAGFPPIPVGPNKGDSDLTIETSGDPTPDGLTAWAYSTDTGKFMANTMAGTADENGVDYNLY